MEVSEMRQMRSYILKSLKITIMFLSLLGIVTWIYFSRQPEDIVSRALKKIPADERMVLECFFRDFLLREGGIYVLTGAKPAALGGYLGLQYYYSQLFLGSFQEICPIRKRL